MYYSSRKENKPIDISSVGMIIKDERANHKGIYGITFSMIGGGKKYWEYYSKEERDLDYQKLTPKQ